MSRSRLRRIRTTVTRVLPSLVVVGAVVVPAGPALAACHAFAVSASPSSVTEGGTVTVTVSRDGDVAPSQVDVSTVDGSARAGQDYVAMRRTVTFDTGTSLSFPLSTSDDGANEPNESFRVRLSNPGGCSANTNFQLGPDAEVTIRDNDAAPSPSARPQPTSPSPRPQTTRPVPRTTAPRPRTTAPRPRTTAPAPAPARTARPTPAPAARTTAAAPQPGYDADTSPTGTPPATPAAPSATGPAPESQRAVALSDDDGGFPGSAVAAGALLVGAALAAYGGLRLRRRAGVG